MTKSTSADWDLWSIGVVIMEILLGPDVVELMDTDQKVRDAIMLARKVIPGDLVNLIDRMTVWNEDKFVRNMIGNPMLNNKIAVAELVYKFDAIKPKCVMQAKDLK